MEAGNASDESEGTIDESEIEEESVEVTEKTRKRKFKMPMNCQRKFKMP